MAITKVFGPLQERSLNSEPSALGGFNVGKYPVNEFRHFPPPATSPQLLRVKDAGVDSWIRGCSRWRKNSNAFSVEFVISGEFSFTQNGKKHLIPANGIFLVKPYCDNEMHCTTAVARKRAVVIAGTMINAIISQRSFAETNTLIPENPGAIEAVMKRIHDSKGSAAENAAMLMELLMLVEAEISPSPYPEPVREIIEYIGYHLDADLSLEALAKKFKISPATLSRYFLNYLHESPRQYIIHRRMDAARQMLRDGNTSIKVIADRLGYCDQLYFSSDFKRRTGVSPRDFRKQFLGKESC